MINKYTSFFSILSFVAIIGCNTNNDNTNEKAEESTIDSTNTVVNCTYSLNNAKTTLYWTAYKHTQKVEVKGTMDSIILTNTTKNENILSIIEGTSFSVFPNSVNSNDEGRDKKIRDHFFGNMKNGNVITGSIIEYNKNGDAKIELAVNGQTVIVPSNVVVENDIIQLRCDINFNNWKANKAQTELNKACEEKHTGIDAVSR